MSRERRREPRYPYRLPVTLRVGPLVQETLTQDVSYRGLFAVSDEPPALRQLTLVSAVLPDSKESFKSHAMSVFVLERGNPLGRTPGCGLQFYAMSGPMKQAWNRFIDSVRRDLGPPIPETRPRRFVRYRVKLAVRPRDVNELYTLYTRDVSKGGMFLFTSKNVEIGSELEVDVVHPLSAETFTLECVVRRIVDGPPKGIGVELQNLDEGRRNAFLEFVHSTIPELDDAALELIESEDPNLA
jgi:Tfp pilus assembly protein PilZ